MIIQFAPNSSSQLVAKLHFCTPLKSVSFSQHAFVANGKKPSDVSVGHTSKRPPYWKGLDTLVCELKTMERYWTSLINRFVFKRSPVDIDVLNIVGDVSINIPDMKLKTK